MQQLYKLRLRLAGLFLLLAVLGSLLACGGWFLVQGLGQRNTDYVLLAQQEYTQKQTDIYQHFQDRLHDPNISPDEEQALLSALDQQAMLLGNMKKARAAGDWQQELTLALEQAEGELELLNAYQISANQADLLANMALNTYLLEHGIPPRVPANSCEALNTLSMFARQFLPVLLPVFAALFGAFQFLPEGQHGGAKLLYQQPVSREKIFHARILAALTQALVWFLLVAAGLFLLTVLLFGLGDPRYPVACPGGFLSTADYLVRVLLLSLGSIVFFVALGITLGSLLRDETALIISAVALPLLGRVLSSVTGTWGCLFPLLSGSASQIITDSGLPLWLPVLSEITFAILCLGGSWLFQRRRDLIYTSSY